MTIGVWFIGHHAFFAANKTNWHKYGLNFALSLGGGASFILALIVGLIIGNFFKGFADYLSVAAKPEWYIKTAIVFLGVKVGYLPIKAAAASNETWQGDGISDRTPFSGRRCGHNCRIYDYSGRALILLQGKMFQAAP